MIANPCFSASINYCSKHMFMARRSSDHFHTRRPLSHSSCPPVIEIHAMNVINSSRRKYTSIVYPTLVALVLFTIFLVVATFVTYLRDKALMKSLSWHGGHPAQDRPGSCWCGGDNYCMCTPSVAIDIVLYSKIANSIDGYNVWVVRRADTGQLATVGG